MFELLFKLFFYRYTKRSTNRTKTRIYWRCIDRKYCNGTCSTNYNLQDDISVLLGKNHIYAIYTIDIKVQEVKRGIKRKAAENPNASLSAIFRSTIAGVSNDDEVIWNLPKRQSILRINRVQNRYRRLNSGF